MSRALALLAGLVALVATSMLVSGIEVARAQEAEPTLQVTAAFDPPASTVGDHVTLRVRVQHPSDLVITVERPTIEGAEVLGEAQPQPQTESQPDGTEVTSYEFRYQVFTLGVRGQDSAGGGEVDAGQIRAHWLREDGATGVSVTDGPVFTVVPVRAPDDQTLRPLKPQRSVGGAPPVWFTPLLIATGIAVALGGVAALVVTRRRRRVEAPAEATPETVEARARARLDALRQRSLASAEAYQAYYGEMALTVRRFLGERFEFNATALTSAELEERMTSHGVDRWQARLVGGLLERCDQAVYARAYPDPASADHDLTVAYEIVELSRERPVAVDEPEPAVVA